jgi:hypothetical protein
VGVDYWQRREALLQRAAILREQLAETQRELQEVRDALTTKARPHAWVWAAPPPPWLVAAAREVLRVLRAPVDNPDHPKRVNMIVTGCYLVAAVLCVIGTVVFWLRFIAR